MAIEITIKQDLLEENDKKATEIRTLLTEKKILMVNFISSPGSGKTTLLEKTIPLLLKRNIKLAIIEGDVETDRDAKRLEKLGVPISLINTRGSCHLEGVSIEKALEKFNLDALDIIFVENVGNLVCPAEFDIGEDMKIAMLSIPEGDDKPCKYPLLFREANLLLLNKIDLLPYSDFNKQSFNNDVNKINANLLVIELSLKTEQGIDRWLDWLNKAILLKTQK
jgi:hydrogenase nickel incorporation protein HypB